MLVVGETGDNGGALALVVLSIPRVGVANVGESTRTLRPSFSAATCACSSRPGSGSGVLGALESVSDAELLSLSSSEWTLRRRPLLKTANAEGWRSGVGLVERTEVKLTLTGKEEPLGDLGASAWRSAAVTMLDRRRKN
jgi:hypothetical protein